MKKLEFQLVPSLSSGITLDLITYGSDVKETISVLSVESSRAIASEPHVTPVPVEVTNGNLTDIIDQDRIQSFSLPIIDCTLLFGCNILSLICPLVA